MKTVAPHQTIEINVKKLRDEQTPDDSGQFIPPNVTKGQLKWSIKQTGSAPAGEVVRQSLALAGRTEQIDIENGISSNYACQNYCESSYESSYLTATSPDAAVGEQVTYRAYQQDYDHYGALTGFYQRIAILNGPTYWYSSQTSVATINSSSLATAVEPGTTIINAAWLDYSAPFGTICEPMLAETDESGEKSASPQQLAPGEPCEACTNYPVFPTPSTVLNVMPTIDTISPDKGSVGGIINISIEGDGLFPGTTINSIPGITFSNVVVYGQFSITAKLTITENATPGINQLKVTTAGKTSAPVDFFVQIPKKARKDQTDNLIVHEPEPGNIDNVFNQRVRTGICGAYRNFKFTLIDQAGDQLEFGSGQGISVTEILTNYQGPVGMQPTANTELTNNIAEFGDTISGFNVFPDCPQNFTMTIDQGFKVVMGSVTYPLTTKNAIAMARTGPGQWTIGSTTVTP